VSDRFGIGVDPRGVRSEPVGGTPAGATLEADGTGASLADAAALPVGPPAPLGVASALGGEVEGAAVAAGVGAGVGAAVGTGVGGGGGGGGGGGVGFGVGGGAGVLMTTAEGTTLETDTVTRPPPLPLEAANEYVWLPAGRVRVVR
jgi:hypothetical protein